MKSIDAGLRASALGIAVNVLLAIGKIAAGILGNSYALIADGIESTADIVSSLVVWGGLRISAIPPDDDHPFGHGKAESISALIVATALILAAIGIGVESIREILTPHHAPAPFTLVVLVVVVVIKEAMFRTVLQTATSLESTALQGDAWHHRSDAITSVAAFIGISVALIGGKGWEPADDYAALLACLVIAWNGTRLLRTAVNEIMDASPAPDMVKRIRSLADAVPGIAGVGRCRVRKSGMGLFIDIHIKVPGNRTVREGHDLAHAVENGLRAGIPTIHFVSVHVEPSAEDAVRTASPTSGL